MTETRPPGWYRYPSDPEGPPQWWDGRRWAAAQGTSTPRQPAAHPPAAQYAPPPAAPGRQPAAAYTPPHATSISQMPLPRPAAPPPPPPRRQVVDGTPTEVLRPGGTPPPAPAARGRFSPAEPEALARRILLGVLIGVAILTVSLVGVVLVAVNGRQTGPGSFGPGAPSDPSAQLLKLSDLPAGWSVDRSSTSDTKDGPTCFRNAAFAGDAVNSADASFLHTANAPFLGETIRSFAPSQVAKTYNAAVHELDGCGQVAFTSGNVTTNGTIARMQFPSVGDESAAYSVTFTGTGLVATFDVLLFRYGHEVVTILYGDLKAVTVSEFQQYVDLAVQKL